MTAAKKKYVDFLLKQKDNDTVKIITGIRGCGKSTLLFELFYDELKKLGIRNAMLNFRQLKLTHTLENIVYLELLRRDYIVDIGNNSSKEIDFMAKDRKNTYYIQVSYSVIDPSAREKELSSFKNLDDGYKKIVITMENDPFTNLKNGYKKVNMLDFLLNENCLEEI